MSLLPIIEVRGCSLLTNSLLQLRAFEVVLPHVLVGGEFRDSDLASNPTNGRARDHHVTQCLLFLRQRNGLPHQHQSAHTLNDDLYKIKCHALKTYNFAYFLCSLCKKRLLTANHKQFVVQLFEYYKLPLHRYHLSAAIRTLYASKACWNYWVKMLLSSTSAESKDPRASQTSATAVRTSQTLVKRLDAPQWSSHLIWISSIAGYRHSGGGVPDSDTFLCSLCNGAYYQPPISCASNARASVFTTSNQCWSRHPTRNVDYLNCPIPYHPLNYLNLCFLWQWCIDVWLIKSCQFGDRNENCVLFLLFIPRTTLRVFPLQGFSQ